jgi:hypothetical protein
MILHELTIFKNVLLEIVAVKDSTYIKLSNGELYM